MGFKIYQRGFRDIEAYVSLLTDGEIYLNITARKKFELNEGGRLTFYFDKEKKLVGMKKVSDDDNNGLKISRAGRGRLLSLWSFCKYNSIDLSEKRSYQLTEQNGMLIFGPVEVIDHGRS